MNEVIFIGDRAIGKKHRPFIIAEMSGNHNGNLERAMAIVKMAADCGADAIKLQTYTADTMTLKCDKPGFVIEDPNSLWHGRNLYDLYQEAHTPWEWHQPLFDYAKALGILAFSSAFDASSVAFLETLNVPAYKVASFENTDIPLIRHVAKTGKPMIISSGTASMDEMRKAVHAAQDAGCTQLIVLKCTSSYPAPASEAHLLSMKQLEKELGVMIGLSDHTKGIGTAIASVALGGVLVEKHVTLSRADGGVDCEFSLEPDELTALVLESTQAWQSLGQPQYHPTDSETASRAFRRSLYVVKDIRKGERFTPAHVRAIRPGFGLPPVEIDRIISEGFAQCDLDVGTALKRSHIGWKS